jgi:hypothetical protein
MQRPSSTPLASEWEPWARELREGHFYVAEEDLPEARLWFLHQGRAPSVLLKDSTRPRALLYRLTQARDSQTGMVHIHGMPQHWQETQQWLGRLALEYRGEGLPGSALKALQACCVGTASGCMWMVSTRLSC